jgi:nucleotide-binding universal stress UspA family protein
MRAWSLFGSLDPDTVLTPRRSDPFVFDIILVGADGSPTAAGAVQKAIAMVKLTGGQLHIVTAYKPEEIISSVREIDEYLKSVGSSNHAESLLANLAAQARIAGVEAKTHMSKRPPADAICEVAVEVNADLIVVGNKGMHGVHRILGSVPNSVAHNAPCDVLVAFTA